MINICFFIIRYWKREILIFFLGFVKKRITSTEDQFFKNLQKKKDFEFHEFDFCLKVVGILQKFIQYWSKLKIKSVSLIIVLFLQYFTVTSFSCSRNKSILLFKYFVFQLLNSLTKVTSNFALSLCLFFTNYNSLWRKAYMSLEKHLK